VLEKRQIQIAWLEQALTAPEIIEAEPVDVGLEHRLARIPQFGDRVLRVIVNVKRTPPCVVTASLIEGGPSHEVKSGPTSRCVTAEIKML